MRTYRLIKRLWRHRRLTFYIPAKTALGNVRWNVRAAWLNTGPPPPPIEMTDEEWEAFERAISEVGR